MVCKECLYYGFWLLLFFLRLICICAGLTDFVKHGVLILVDLSMRYHAVETTTIVIIIIIIHAAAMQSIHIFQWVQFLPSLPHCCSSADKDLYFVM